MCQETTVNTSHCSFRHNKHVSGDVVNFYASFPFFLLFQKMYLLTPVQSPLQKDSPLHAQRLLMNVLQQILMDASNKQWKTAPTLSFEKASFNK